MFSLVNSVRVTVGWFAYGILKKYRATQNKKAPAFRCRNRNSSFNLGQGVVGWSTNAFLQNVY